MKCLSVRVIAPSVLLVSTVLSPVLAWSMDEMTDSQLSTATGQDGITIMISPPAITAADAAGYTVGGQTLAALDQTNGLKIGAVVLHDKDGYGSTYNKGGAIIFGDASQATSIANPAGVQMGLYGSAPISVKIDASGNGAVAAGIENGDAPVLNINIGLPADLLIRTGDVSVAASNRNSVANPIPVGVSGATIANAAIGGTQGNAYKILNSMDIALGAAVSMNMQLGNTPQGSMINFGAFVIPSLTLNVSLASPNCQYVANVCTPSAAVPASSLGFEAILTDLDLSGLQMSVVSDLNQVMPSAAVGVGGLLFSQDLLTVGKIELNGVMAGNACDVTCAAGASIAKGMPNAPMGSFGATGMTVTNLKIGVSGM